jgi:uncharacterized protein YjbI with pentapeptide repeats
MDRYTEAITQLASGGGPERIEAIHALERVMAGSARHHAAVVEVLAAFVRQRVTLPPGDLDQDGRAPEMPEPLAADVQAAMTALARRPERDEEFPIDLRRTTLAGLELTPGARLAGANLAEATLTRATLVGANLDGANLTGANLVRAALTGADLGGAKLTRANLAVATLSEANLVRATLIGANLTLAKMTEADLTEAALTGANLFGAALNRATLTGVNLVEAALTGADFGGAKMTGADLFGAILAGANLVGATLSGARGLVAAQLSDAVVTAETALDEALAQNAWVVARIKACRGWKDRDLVPAPTPEPDGGQ